MKEEKIKEIYRVIKTRKENGYPDESINKYKVLGNAWIKLIEWSPFAEYIVTHDICNKCNKVFKYDENELGLCSCRFGEMINIQLKNNKWVAKIKLVNCIDHDKIKYKYIRSQRIDFLLFKIIGFIPYFIAHNLRAN